jgi:hypothetical protein
LVESALLSMAFFSRSIGEALLIEAVICGEY